MFLEGSWRLDKTLEDELTARRSEFEGFATFVPVDTGLMYEERGVHIVDDQRLDAQQSLHYLNPTNDQAEVRFADGRPFHVFRLSETLHEVVHLCEADTYHGSFRLVDDESWESTWQVQGPHKNYVVHSQYRRASET